MVMLDGACSTVSRVTRAIEYLTTVIRAAATGADTSQPLAWAKQEIDALIVPAIAVPTSAPDAFKSEVPDGYNTILGYLAETSPAMLDLMEEPVSDTCRDGWWLTHRCKDRGQHPVKVPAPAVCAERGIMEVNAYPVDLLERRFG